MKKRSTVTKSRPANHRFHRGSRYHLLSPGKHATPVKVIGRFSINGSGRTALVVVVDGRAVR